MDPTNRRILEILQLDARLSFSEIAKKLKKPESTIRDRVRNMERRGIIKGYCAIVDRNAIGFEADALLFCNIKPEKQESVLKELMNVRNVCGLFFVSGERRVAVKLCAKNNREISQVVRDRLIPLGLEDVESRMIMDTVERFPPEGLMPIENQL